MDVFEKLRMIRDVIQQDVGNRGLARDPHDNLINACPDDYVNASRSIAENPKANVAIITGFVIPTADPICAETDGPLGAIFLGCGLARLDIPVLLATDFAFNAVCEGMKSSRLKGELSVQFREIDPQLFKPGSNPAFRLPKPAPRKGIPFTHLIALERVGPNHTLESLRASPNIGAKAVADFKAIVPKSERDCCYTMRGFDITEATTNYHVFFERQADTRPYVTIGIGDGGNEIGMGKIPWDTIRRNIPNGELIACRVPTDHLIVAGVSNWGAYALAAGVALLRGVELPDELFDPDRERAILQTMVDAGPLVDGVTGQRTATVDGLTWEQYIEPLVRIREIMKM